MEVLGLERRTSPAGEVVITEGSASEWFMLVVDGQARVSRATPDGELPLSTAEPASILGELGLLAGEPRSASVTAATELTYLIGDADDFHRLLELDGMRNVIATTVAGRLAGLVTPIEVSLGSGQVVRVRPGLPTDRGRLEAALGQMSAESLHRRFFSGGMPSQALISYLVDINYVDHFVWVVLDGVGPDAPAVATVRLIRSADDPTSGELALAIIDRYQGRGIGSLLMELLAISADVLGIGTLTALVLSENTPMRSLLDKAGAHWHFDEPGVVATAVLPADVPRRLDPSIVAALGAAVAAVVEGSGLVLVR